MDKKPNLQKRIKLLTRTLAILIYIVICSGIVGIGYTRFFFADDFAFFADLRDRFNLIEFAINGFLNWDGRHLTITGLVQTLLTRYFPPEYGVIFWALCFVIMCAIFIKSIIRLSIRIDFVIIAFFVSVIWISYKAHCAQTIYWVNGGIYTFNLLLFSILIFIGSKKKMRPFAFNIFALFIGATTQNLSVGVAFIFFALLVIKLIRNKKIDYHLLFPLIFIILGTLYISFAPGNSVRMNTIEYSLTPVIFIKNYFQVLIFYLGLTKAGIFFSFLFSLICLKYRFVSNRLMDNSTIINSIIWIGAALVTIIPFAIISPHFASNRTSLYFQFFLIVGLVFLWSYILLLIRARTRYLKTTIRFLYYPVILVFGVYIFINVMVNVKEGVLLKKKVEAREYEIIQEISLGNKDIITDRIEVKRKEMNFCTIFHDITEEPADYRNRGMARYYEINTIRTK